MARLALLVLAAGIGGFATYYFTLNIQYVIEWMGVGESSFWNRDSSDRLWVNITLLIMSLPVLLILWWFRTHDTRQQIEDTQKQLAESIKFRETSTYQSLLSSGLEFIASDDVAGRCIGLVQLALVRNGRQEYSDQIEMYTQDLALYTEEDDESEAEVSKLRGAMLESMNLSGAIMQGAHLEAANLKGADLKGADLTGADLKGADLKRADLKGADLKRADLKGADLKGADLKGADLKGADLTGGDLKGVDLMGADLTGANLTKANLNGADLTGTILTGANLTRTIFQNAKYNESTQISSTFNFANRGLKKVD